MRNIRQNNTVFLNMDTVTNVFSWGGQLSATLGGAVDDIKIGDLVLAVRNDQVIAAGRITERFFCVTHQNSRDSKGHVSKRWVRMNLHVAEEPVSLSTKQAEMLQAVAQAYDYPYPGFQDVLAVPKKDALCFSELEWKFQHLSNSVRTAYERFHSDEIFHLMDRTDIMCPVKVRLCQALGGRGEIKTTVLERDEHRIESDHELDLVATRIVPWEACSDDVRLDPDNYVLMDEQLAEHFAMGLISFRNTGQQIHDPTMDEDAFDPWVDQYFNFPELNAQQKKYMAYHREYVYMQWRTGLPKPMYAPGL